MGQASLVSRVLQPLLLVKEAALVTYYPLVRLSFNFRQTTGVNRVQNEVTMVPESHHSPGLQFCSAG